MTVKMTMDLNNNYYTPDIPLEIPIDKEDLSERSIKESLVRSIKNIFRTPPVDKQINDILNLEPDDTTIEEILSKFNLHNYNTTDEQFKLLRKFNYGSLSKDNRWKYCGVMTYICNKRQEYGLSIKYIDEALHISDENTEVKIQLLLEKAIILSIIEDHNSILICKKVLKPKNKTKKNVKTSC